MRDSVPAAPPKKQLSPLLAGALAAPFGVGLAFPLRARTNHEMLKHQRGGHSFSQFAASNGVSVLRQSFSGLIATAPTAFGKAAFCAAVAYYDNQKQQGLSPSAFQVGVYSGLGQSFFEYPAQIYTLGAQQNPGAKTGIGKKPAFFNSTLLRPYNLQNVGLPLLSYICYANVVTLFVREHVGTQLSKTTLSKQQQSVLTSLLGLPFFIASPSPSTISDTETNESRYARGLFRDSPRTKVQLRSLAEIAVSELGKIRENPRRFSNICGFRIAWITAETTTAMWLAGTLMAQYAVLTNTTYAGNTNSGLFSSSPHAASCTDHQPNPLEIMP